VFEGGDGKMIGEIAALSAAFCWALSAVMYKNVLAKTGYLAANLVRSAFAVLFLILVLPFVFSESAVLLPNEYAILASGGITNLVIGDTLYFVGLKQIGVCQAQPISYSYPLLVMFLAAMVLGEPLTSSVLIGTPLIVLGVIVISLGGNQLECDSSNRSRRVIGLTSSVAAALFWSVGLVCYKLALSDHMAFDPALSTFATIVRTSVILPFLLVLVFASGESKRVARLDKTSTVTLGLAGILALGVGGILLFTSYSLINANIATPLSSTSPLFSLVLARRYAGEKATLKVIIGAILIVIGVMLVSVFAS
jgi:drug/metabolite transporter (DMT)-like permease